MRNFALPVILFGLSLMPSAAVAQWAVRCDGNFTRIEGTICKYTALRELDRLLVVLLRGAGPDEARQHEDWKRWRDTCRSDPACLERRYRSRISEIGGPDAGSAGTAQLNAVRRDLARSRQALQTCRETTPQGAMLNSGYLVDLGAWAANGAPRWNRDGGGNDEKGDYTQSNLPPFAISETPRLTDWMNRVDSAVETSVARLLSGDSLTLFRAKGRGMEPMARILYGAVILDAITK